MATSTNLRNRARFTGFHFLRPRRISLIRGPPEAHNQDEIHKVHIPFDYGCRWEPAEVIHAHRIARHSLMDDNPSSG